MTVEPFLNQKLFVSLYFEAESGHTGSVLIDSALAIARGIIGLGEEHTLIAFGFFVLADTAWLLPFTG